MRFAIAALAVAAALVVPAAASACSVVIPDGYEGSSAQVRDASQAIGNASAVIDGEVVQAFAPGKNALVRVHKSYKGELPHVIEVGDGGGDSCAIILKRQGERSRMILSGGPAVYTLLRDQSGARIEDKILKSDRRKAWPYFMGQSGPSK